jgi:hypothetical protein
MRRAATFIGLSGLLVGLLGGALTGCRAVGPPARTPATPSPEVPPMGPPAVAALIPERVRDRAEWAEAIVNALGANGLAVDRESACAVIAIIGQESGFEADPVVPGLARVAAERLHRDEARLGPLGEPIVRRLLSGRAPDDPRTFAERLEVVRTERDVDVLFRDIVAYYETNHPAWFETARLAGRLFDVRDVRALNPITTSGSMQVSVRFAEAWAEAHPGKATTPGEIRDALYTRAGGVYYGTARLLVYPVRYGQPIFRFADYNAGFYASRNAALQVALSRLTGRALVADGDLLAYEKDGSIKEDTSESERAVQILAERFAPTLSPSTIRADLRLEKTLQLEDTATYRTIVNLASRRRVGGVGVAYAILPQVAISSPKFAGTRSTAWFAEAVDRRYRACLAR